MPVGVEPHHAVFEVLWPSKSRKIFLVAVGFEWRLKAWAMVMGTSGASGWGVESRSIAAGQNPVMLARPCSARLAKSHWPLRPEF